MELLRQSLEEQKFLLDVEASDLETTLRLTLTDLGERGHIDAGSVDDLLDQLMGRERVASTAIGHGVAVPHVYSDRIASPVIAFVRLAHPLNLGAPDGVPTRFLFVLLGSPDATSAHLDTLTQIARLTSDDEFRYELTVAKSGRDLIESLEHFRERSGEATATDLPVSEPTEPLAYTGTLAGGMRADLSRRLPHYGLDLREGLHPKTLSATIFMFFACLAPAITFGGLMADETEGAIGTVEMIAATACCGVMYALVSGAPLAVLGGTGPLLVLTALLYNIVPAFAGWAGVVLAGEGAPPGAPTQQEFFLGVYAWVGIWTAVILVILAVTDASFLMRYFTRFTNETFSALISVIFIYKAIEKLLGEFGGNGSETPYHATALLSLFLAAGTFWIAMNLSRFRNSRYLYPWMREFLSDFGPTIAILLMTVVAVWFDVQSREWEDKVHLTTLQAPEVLATTYEVEPATETSPAVNRGWFVNPLDVSNVVKLLAIGPAFLVALLIFINQNITSRLVNSPANKTRGAAHHWDLMVVGVFVALCSLFGLPWLVATMVPSLNHVRSLATVEEVVTQGTPREHVIHTRENRLSGLFVHLLLGASLAALGLMRQIPMAVLYGLFLYMGVVSMSGNQFFERLALWPTDPDLYPRTHYVRKVPRRVIHVFTLMQLLCLVFLWILKDSPVGILFPLFIALLVPLRILSAKWIDERYLEILDAEEAPEEEQTHYA